MFGVTQAIVAKTGIVKKSRHAPMDIREIYGTHEQHKQLWEWLNEVHAPEEVMKGMYKYDLMDALLIPRDEMRAISDFSAAADGWLADHCPLEFVLRRISQQYGRRRFIVLKKLRQLLLKKETAREKQTTRG